MTCRESGNPRRKLCLDSSDDSPPVALSRSLSSDSSSPPLLYNDHSNASPLYSRRQRNSLILPGKENVTNIRSLSSLPASPLSTTDVRFTSLLRQISSPMGRMRIESPTPPMSSCTSENSNESDGYFSEVFDHESTSDENSNSSIPESINSLLTKPFTEQCTSVKFSPAHNPHNAPKRHTSFRNLKRPTPPENKELLPGEKFAKRPPLIDVGNKLMSPPTTNYSKPIKGTSLFRSQSISVPSPTYKKTLYPVSPGEGGVEQIGDHSKPYILPLMSESANVADQKNITPETLSRLLKNDYSDLVSKYTIVDCRYPYEYEGGHIKGAINIWDKDEMLRHFFTSPSLPDEDANRNIIIFHCEFSTKRGPEMSRFMRKIDRERNGMQFPRLYYPEIYLLHAGYKNFYNSYPCLCEPQSYKCMLDENHKDDLKKFSKRSKSWSGNEMGGATVSRRRQHHLLRHRHSTHESSRELGSPTN